MTFPEKDLQLAVCLAFKKQYPFRQVQEAFDFADNIWAELKNITAPTAYIVQGTDIDLSGDHIGALTSLDIKTKDSRETTTNKKPSAEEKPKTKTNQTATPIKRAALPQTQPTTKTTSNNNLPPLQAIVLKAITKLATLGNNEITGRNINAMCDQLGQRPSNLTMVLTALENKGYIETRYLKGSANQIKLLAQDKAA